MWNIRDSFLAIFRFCIGLNILALTCAFSFFGQTPTGKQEVLDSDGKLVKPGLDYHRERGVEAIFTS